MLLQGDDLASAAFGLGSGFVSNRGQSSGLGLAANASTALAVASISSVDAAEQQVMALQQMPGEQHWKSGPTEDVEQSLHRARLKVRIQVADSGQSILWRKLLWASYDR